MNNEKFQDKYDEVIEELKSQKMNWDFEDFISQVEEKSQEEDPKIIPLSTSKKPKVSKFFWMAASMTLIAGISFVLFSKNLSDNEEKNKVIAQAIQNQQEEFAAENSIVQAVVVDSVQTQDEISQPVEVVVATNEDVLDKIVSKKERIKKINKQRYTSVDESKTKTSAQDIPYQSNYVIINGQKITNEEEAINVARFSMKMVSDKMNQTIASAVDPMSDEN